MSLGMQVRIGMLFVWTWVRPVVSALALALWALALAIACGTAYADEFEDRVQDVTANSESVLWGRIHDLEDRVDALESRKFPRAHAAAQSPSVSPEAQAELDEFCKQNGC